MNNPGENPDMLKSIVNQVNDSTGIMATTHTDTASSNVTGAKRKSRFDSAPSNFVPDQHPPAVVDGFTSSVHPAPEKLNIDLIAAALKASEFSREISNKVDCD